MEVLLECGGDVNALNNAGSTPLFLATEGLHRTASLVGGRWWGGGGGERQDERGISLIRDILRHMYSC